MFASINGRTKNMNKAVKLEMSVDEAVALEALLGILRGEAAATFPGWYDDIADVLEEGERGANALWLAEGMPHTIYQAAERHRETFRVLEEATR
jgi:hypothetical protein